MERYEKPVMTLEEIEDEVYTDTDTARGPYLTTAGSEGNKTPVGTEP